jgi:hypothetical protein
VHKPDGEGALATQYPETVMTAVAAPLAFVIHGEFTATLPPLVVHAPVIVAEGTGLPDPSVSNSATLIVPGVEPAPVFTNVGFAVSIAVPTLIVTVALKPPVVNTIVGEDPGSTPAVMTVVSMQPDAPVAPNAPEVLPLTVPVAGARPLKLKLMIAPGIGLPTASFRHTATV